MIVAGQLSDCCRAAQRLLQGSSVNFAGQLSECCSSVNVACISVNVAGQLSE